MDVPFRSLILTFAALVLAFPSAAEAGTMRPESTHWVAPIWIASPSYRRASPVAGERVAFENETVWQMLRVQRRAKRIRLRLTNELGNEAVEVAALTLVAAGRTMPVLFSGNMGVRLAPGEARVSDPVDVALVPTDEVAIGTYYSAAARPVAHRGHIRVEQGRSTSPPDVASVRGPAIVSAIEAIVTERPCGRTIVALGDSITEGVGAPRRMDWPSQLAQRVALDRCPARILNAGIGGNRALSNGGSPSLLNRLDRDVLALGGVTDIILLIGINDIRAWLDSGTKPEPLTESLLDAYRQVVARARTHGIRVIGGTLTPHRGAGRQDETTLALVAAVNRAICTGAIFDTTIDFGAVVADPVQRDRLSPAANSGDWLHLSAEGYRIMAAAVPIALLRRGGNARRSSGC